MNGRIGFLDELTGDFVIHLRTAPSVTIGSVTLPAIADFVGADQEARIFPEQARFGVPCPLIVYTQVSGHSTKVLAGLDGSDDIGLHVYAYSSDPTQARLLATAIRQRCLSNDNAIWGEGTIVSVCNGGIIDSGTESARDNSDVKLFWVRLLLKMVVQ